MRSRIILGVFVLAGELMKNFSENAKALERLSKMLAQLGTDDFKEKNLRGEFLRSDKRFNEKIFFGTE